MTIDMAAAKETTPAATAEATATTANKSKNRASASRKKSRKEKFQPPTEIVTNKEEPGNDNSEEGSRLTDPFVDAVVQERFRIPGSRQRREPLGLATSRSSSMNMVRVPPRRASSMNARIQPRKPKSLQDLAGGKTMFSFHDSLGSMADTGVPRPRPKPQAPGRGVNRRRSCGDLPQEINQMLVSRRQDVEKKTKRERNTQPQKQQKQLQPQQKNLKSDRKSFANWLLNDHDPKANPHHRPGSRTQTTMRRSSLSSINENGISVAPRTNHLQPKPQQRRPQSSRRRASTGGSQPRPTSARSIHFGDDEDDAKSSYLSMSSASLLSSSGSVSSASHHAHSQHKRRSLEYLPNQSTRQMRMPVSLDIISTASSTESSTMISNGSGEVQLLDKCRRMSLSF